MDNVLPRPLECLLEIRRLINSSIQPRLSMISFRIIFNLTKIPAPFLRSRYSDLSIRKASDIYIYIFIIHPVRSSLSNSLFSPFSLLHPNFSADFSNVSRFQRPTVSQPPHGSSLVITKSRPAPLFRLVPGSRPFLLPCNHIRGV